MSQTSYSVNQVAGAEGQLADDGKHDVISMLNDIAAMPFGVLAIKGASDKSCILPALATDVTNGLKVAGVSLRTQAIETARDSNPPSYPQKSMVSVLKKGRVYVKVEEAVTPTDPVYVRYAAGGNGVGSFGKTAGSTERALLAGASYASSAGVNGFAILELNLPA